MSDEREPLPQSSDPHVVLGVDPAADERELKRAYARRIKVYRPDRAPAEFARVQDAFERARAMLHLRALMADDEEEAPEPPASPPPAAVVAAEPPPAPVPVPMDDADQPVTWRELSRRHEVGEAYERWMRGFAARVTRPETQHEAVAMAGEPALIEDAAHDPAAAMLALRAVSCLAWRDWHAASVTFRKLRTLASHPIVDRMVDRATLDLEVAGNGQHAARLLEMPPLMRQLLADGPIMSLAERASLQERLRTSLRDDTAGYLEVLDRAVGKRKAVSEALAHRLLDGAPAHRRELDTLPPKLGAELDREMRGASRHTWWILPVIMIVCGVIAAVLTWEALEGFQIADDKEDDEQLYATGLVFSAGLCLALALDWVLYRTLVRRRMARLLAHVGVTRAAARQWLAASWLRVRLRRFSIWMEADHVLRLVGLLAATAGDDRGLDDDD